VHVLFADRFKTRGDSLKYLRGLSLSLFNLNPKEFPKELFGREKELDELVRLVKARRWIAILGPRMVGKTSLIKAANVKLEKTGVKAIYVNLWGAKGTHGLLNALAQGLNKENSVLQKIRDIANRTEGVSFGPGGISISLSKRPMTTMWDLLGAIGKQAGDCVIELDEVQELSAISGHLLRLLANIFNTHPNVVFILTGSMFGLMKMLLEPRSTSPMYGRSPAKLYLEPFTKEKSGEFLKKGFQECHEATTGEQIEEAVEKLDGIPGWLTLYGNKVAVRKLPHKKAMQETISEGMKMAKDELEHFLQGRDRTTYLAALKVAATSARWKEIKAAIETRRNSVPNDATVQNALEGLKAAMLTNEEEGVYTIKDPMLRKLLLTSQIS
jgi:AAA+ ATPase superfamily predicted ATPase